MFLHFSYMRNIEDTVQDNIDFDLIKTNIGLDNYLCLDNYIKNIYFDIMNNTTSTTLNNLINLCNINLDIIKKF